MKTIDLGGDTLSLHLVGIGGAGMSAIATVLMGMDHRVSGSDLKESRTVERLRASGIDVAIGHRAENVGDVDYVSISTAVPPTNPELVAANERGIEILTRQQTLTSIVQHCDKSITVAGTHGKTTTSSMLTVVLLEAGFAPSFIVGGEVNEIGSGAAWNGPELILVEGDESDGSFLSLNGGAVVVTNIEPDHVEHYGGEQGVFDAFNDFVSGAEGPVVMCADDERSAAAARANGAITYGTAEDSTYQIVDVNSSRSSSTFAIKHDGAVVCSIELAAPGLHNIRNATAAAVVAMEIGATPAAVADGLRRYSGVARRFEFRGEVNGITFVDDYAHLPTEVEAALEAASDNFNRIVCVFQPHRYSRTEALWQEFSSCFEQADLLIVTDIYSAGEAPRPGITGKLVLDSVLGSFPHTESAWMPRLVDVEDFLVARLQPGDLCLTLGAGDLTATPTRVIDRLRGGAADG